MTNEELIAAIESMTVLNCSSSSRPWKRNSVSSRLHR